MNEPLEEQAALYALELLEGEERNAFEAELRANDELRAFLYDLRETAAQCAHVAPLRQPPAELEGRIWNAIRGVAPAAAAERAKVFPNWVPWALAACLTLACVMLLADRTAAHKELARLQSRDAASQLQIAMLASKLDSAPNAAAVVLWDAAKQEGVLKVSNVPAAGGNRDYQLWIVDPDYKQPVDAGVFNVKGEGATEIRFQPKAKVRSANAFAVSLERKGGVPKAEGPMVLVGK
ncbi:MAG: anti-sigma factor [Verrucomicrobiota bacterium]|nr:anti-sigma factor [Verrucomicrobiota bacterium]